MKLLIGPYVGDFKNEIMVFIPYMHYISTIIEYDELYVSSYNSSKFLYNYIDEELVYVSVDHLLPPYSEKTGIILKDYNKYDYQKIQKSIKKNINADEVHSLPYIQNEKFVPLYQKIYKPFNKKPERNNSVCLIYNGYHDWYNDINADIKFNTDIINNNEVIFDYIHKARYVITNCSEWALICNLQQIPVYYIGYDASVYKTDGIFGFGNINISLKFFNKGMIDRLLEKIGG